MIMRKLYVLFFILFLSEFVYSGNEEIEFARVVFHDFPEVISGWGYIEPIGKNGETGLRIKISSAPAGLSYDKGARIILKDKDIPGRVSNVSYSKNGLSCDILPSRKISLPLWKFARWIIILDIRRKRPAVPNEAVLDKAGNKFVIVKGENRFVKQSVAIGLVDDSFTEIISGLKRGEEVVTTGSYEILHQNIREEYKVED